MAEQVPVTPALLTWARERAGLSRDAAIEKFRKFGDWEDGRSSPTYPQLESVSEALKIPIAVFFFPEPPRVPPIEETFRTLPGVEYARLPSRVRLLLRKAKALQLNLAELANGRNPSERLITRDLAFASNVNIASMARTVREYIGVSLEAQQKWRDDETAMKEWRSALLNVGIFVFKDAFRVPEFSGFCLYDENFPIVYVNNSSTKTRQIFTQFHELAHLLFHTSGVDKLHDDYIDQLRGEDQRIEVLCNRFAAEFLLPEAEFEAAVAGREASRATAEAIAARYHVSREVVFRRFLDRNRVDQNEYVEAVEAWNAQRVQGGPGGDHYWSKLSYLGREYVALALRAYHQNRIDEDQLADFLDTKPRNLSTLESYFERGAA
ncbi:MAG: ImmA/IrrE family metallo-endopeptidase [Phenylobacterium sp.]|uniref:ImmA/IrrE family metallo-endopeptidase n=1 Tax=Phenylobacterium sp. TaxID=1871053 RepID=UPI001A5241D3|nr:ImmA/IrrE family metallo-endopeptidase [Phenylobacterium sp.]MBL8554403.1 ImmA/IrrE family metallo-endopeptidase [Phenylobacterium sp.]